MKTYYDLDNYFKTQLSKINGIGDVLSTDTIDNKFEVKNYDTALAVVSIEPTTSNDSFVAYDVRIEIVDTVDVDNNPVTDKYNGNNNIKDVYNFCLASVRRIHLQLQHKTSGNNKIQVDAEPSIEKLFDKTQSVAGMAIDMVINIDDGMMSLCGDENGNA